MKFNESNVFTPLNADQVAAGSKGYFAETLGNLKNVVAMQGPTSELTYVRDETNACRFYCKGDKSGWLLFYLVEAPDLCTCRELAKWLAQGQGEYKHTKGDIASMYFHYSEQYGDNPVKADSFVVRKWGDPEWHAPTRKYMGIEE